MKKKLLVVAITGALGAVPAVQADTANVNISGKFYPAYVKYSGGEATDGEVPTSTIFSVGDGVPDQDAIEAFNTNIRFRADFDIGGGMKAITQVEQTLRLDTGGGVWANRNSAAGLAGGFGTVLLGNWDTPFKQLHFPTNIFGVSSGSPVSNSGLLSRTPFSAGDSAASFHRRQNNSIQYWSPDLNGLQFKAMYGTEEDDDGMGIDPTRTSASVTWEQGPLMVGFAYEVHDDFFGAASGLEQDPGNDFQGSGQDGGGTGSKDTGMTVAVVYKIGKTTEIGFDYESLDYEIDGQTAGNIKSYERDAWRVGVEHKVGKGTIAFNYGSADEGDCKLVGVADCSTKDLDGTQMSVGYKHDLAKNASLYAWWTKIDNGDSASYSFLDAAPTGADPSAYAFGVLLRW
jgi:predicted porin